MSPRGPHPPCPICISLGVLGVLEGPVEVRFSRVEAREPGPRVSSRFVYTIGPYAFGTTYKRRSGETGMPCAGRAQSPRMRLGAPLDRPLRHDQLRQAPKVNAYAPPAPSPSVADAPATARASARSGEGVHGRTTGPELNENASRRAPMPAEGTLCSPPLQTASRRRSGAEGEGAGGEADRRRPPTPGTPTPGPAARPARRARRGPSPSPRAWP